MDAMETTLQRLGAWLSTLMDPLAEALERLGFAIRVQLGQAGVPDRWDGTVITTVWVLVLAMAIRTFTGWLRLVVVVVAAAVLAKVYGVLPGG